MEHYIALAGPTLDKALALKRLGLADTRPAPVTRLDRASCDASCKGLKGLRESLPRQLASILTPSPNNPVHLLVADARDMHRGGVVRHLCSQDFPPGSFSWMAPGVLVPSWPLYFVMRCRTMGSLPARLMLGMELCGTYAHLVTGDRVSRAFSRQPTMTADGELVERWDSPRVVPATDVKALEKYLDSAVGIRGVRPATQALRHLLDRSASPAESALALMTSLPCAMGGYGFANLTLNPKVKVEAAQRHLTRADCYHPDSYLPELSTDLEYASDAHHSGRHAVRHDKSRRNDIQALGIEVKDVTWEMLSHVDSLDLLFEQLLDKEWRLGLDPRRRHRRAVRNPDNQTRRRSLLHELLPPWPYDA